MKITLFRSSGEVDSVIEFDSSSENNTGKIRTLCDHLIAGNKCDVEGFIVGSRSLADLLANLKANAVEFDIDLIYNEYSSFWLELMKKNIELISTIIK